MTTRNTGNTLVWDRFRVHKTEQTKILKEMDTELAVIPEGLTNQLQLLDVLINKPFKNCMQQKWNKWMAKPHRDFTAAGHETSDNFRNVYPDEKFMGRDD